MEYWNGVKLKNDDLVACYPRRIQVGKYYEIWQFPYVRNNILHDGDDIVAITFLDNHQITVISEHSDRLNDQDYLNRIINLVHDISKNDYVVKTELVDDLDSEKTKNFLDRVTIGESLIYHIKSF